MDEREKWGGKYKLRIIKSKFEYTFIAVQSNFSHAVFFFKLLPQTCKTSCYIVP